MRKLFGTDGIRGIAGEELTAELAFRLGLALSEVLRENAEAPKVIIGKDTRLSGDMFEAAITAGLCSSGTDVWLTGIVPTPAVAYLVVREGADAGVMISASHNPSEYNGIKIFGKSGFKLSDVLEEKIEALMEKSDISSGPGRRIGRVVTGTRLLDEYEEHVRSIIKPFGRNRKILFDLSNGSASNTAKSIFNPDTLPGGQCDFMAYDPDGININRNCGSTQMNALCRYVVDGGYDMGIAFDGDADRYLMCDENGNILDGDMIICALAENMKFEGKLKGNAVAVTKLSNLGLHKYLGSIGISVRQTDVGDRYVLEEMLRSDLSIGGEQSGHIILRNYATTGDGQITAAVCINLVNRYENLPVSVIFGKMRRLPQVSVNVSVPNGIKKTVASHPEVKKITEAVERRLNGNGRVLIRPSGTEALVRVMLEGENVDILNEYAEEIKKVIAEISNVGGR